MFLIIGFAFIILGIVSFVFDLQPILNKADQIISPLSNQKPTLAPRPLEKYYFENLRQRVFVGSQIKLEKVIQEEEKYTSWLFSFSSENKKVTGMVNIPKGKEEKWPAVIMLRGYADDEIYFTGLGTRKAAGVFAENGFITLAPDFLGFGGSDSSSADILEARFERPATVLNLLASLETLPQINPRKIYLWAHSNGGQIALSVLEILSKEIPTTLWAPVTKGFPESITHYMSDNDDELEENGKMVKTRIETFLKDYDPKKVSIDNYFQDIKASLQIHQGGRDDLVPREWSDEFVAEMREKGKGIIYFYYPKSDHNLKEDWDLVVERDLEFFRKF